jgi:hypothetical protein
MAAEREHFLTRREVPEFHGLIGACRGEALPVWTEHCAVDTPGMATQGPDLLAGPSVPDLNLAIGTVGRISGARGEPSAIAAEAHAQDLCAMPVQGPLFLAGLGIPDFHGFIVAG